MSPINASQILRFNATAGAISPLLPPLAALGVGAAYEVRKDDADVSINTVTVTCAAGDTFDSGGTTIMLALPGAMRVVQVIAPNGVKVWTVVAAYDPGGSPTSSTVLATRRYRAARGTADLAPCNIMAIGDSMTDGQGAGLASNRWTERLLAAERARYQPKGIAGGRGYRAPYWSSPSLQASDPPCVLVGGTAGTIGFGPGLGGRGARLAAGITATYTTASCTSIDVLWQQLTGANSGGTMQVTIDGNPQATVDTSGARHETSATRYTFGARGVHTVVVTATAGFVLFEGIVEYDQDESAGIRMFEAGHYSWTTATYSSNLYANNTLVDQVTYIKPALVVFALGVNDYLNQIDPATAAVSRALLIGAIKAAAGIVGIPVPSIVMLALRCSTVASPTFPYSAYVGRYGADAAADPTVLSVLDETTQFPDPTTDSTLFYDGLHHSPTGHALDANIVGKYLA